MRHDMDFVEEIREISRVMVRQFGFMGGAFAGQALSPSAVHALIEIEKGAITARDLSSALRLEKSTVSRMVRKLVKDGYVIGQEGERDGRIKLLSLTASGKRLVTAIHSYARAQVLQAVGSLNPVQRRLVVDGMRLYARGLTQPNDSETARDVDVVSGYQPGLIARITEMHSNFYASKFGFGQRFESVVAIGLAQFCERLANGRNAVWTLRRGGDIVGSVAIDGEDLGGGIAHLRWFIVDDGMRGYGVGKKLLDAALAFADQSPFAETHLWTFSDLRAARHLYESRGFTLREEQIGYQWGIEVQEQRFVRKRPNLTVLPQSRNSVNR